VPAVIVHNPLIANPNHHTIIGLAPEVMLTGFIDVD